MKKFLIPILLLVKFGCQSFVTKIEVSQMSRHSVKPNKLRNVNTLRRGTRNVAIPKRELKKVKIKIIVFVINLGWNRLRLINPNPNENKVKITKI